MNEKPPTIETQITTSEHGTSSSTIWTLLYDADCPFCRMLAGLLAGPVMPMGEKDPAFTDIALADLTQDPPHLITGSDAWEILLKTEPRLLNWGWLADRLGLTNKSAALALRTGAHLVRRLCWGCKPLIPLITKSNHSDPQNQEKEAI